MQRPLRLPGAFQLHARPVRHHGHGVLHHAREPPRHIPFFQRRGLGRGLAHHPGHPVPLHEAGVKRQPPAFERNGPQAAAQKPQTVGIIIGGVMLYKNKLAGRQGARVRAEHPVFPHKHRIVPAVEAEPVVGPGHDVHQMPPVVPTPPDKLQRREAVKRRVQHPGNDGSQVGPFQIPHETSMQFFRFRHGRFPLRRSGPERKMRTVQHAVLAGKHGRGHLVVGGKLPQYGRVVAALAQHGVRVRQGIQPAVQFSEKHARVLPRGQFGAQIGTAERDKRTVRCVNTFRHVKSLRFPAIVAKKRRLCPERARAMRGSFRPDWPVRSFCVSYLQGLASSNTAPAMP